MVLSFVFLLCTKSTFLLIVLSFFSGSKYLFGFLGWYIDRKTDMFFWPFGKSQGVGSLRRRAAAPRCPLKLEQFLSLAARFSPSVIMKSAAKACLGRA